jgi:hypothetical protein
MFEQDSSNMRRPAISAVSRQSVKGVAQLAATAFDAWKQILRVVGRTCEAQGCLK